MLVLNAGPKDLVVQLTIHPNDNSISGPSVAVKEVQGGFKGHLAFCFPQDTTQHAFRRSRDHRNGQCLLRVQRSADHSAGAPLHLALYDLPHGLLFRLQRRGR